MTFRRNASLFVLMAIAAWTCGCVPTGLPGDQESLTNNVDSDTDSDAGAHIVAPSGEASLSEFRNAFVLSVPIVGASLSGDAAGQFTALAAQLSSPAWGSGAVSFDVPGVDWLPPVRAILTEAAGRGGHVRNCVLPLAAVGSGPITGTLADLRPAPGMATVGVLPIVFITTDFEGYPGSGTALDVGLWSQHANCASCAFESPTRFHQETAPLISAIEIRQLRDAGLWNDRLVAVIAKTGIWWAQSDSSTRVRNWMILQPTGGQASQVRCLTVNGLWPE